MSTPQVDPKRTARRWLLPALVAVAVLAGIGTALLTFSMSHHDMTMNSDQAMAARAQQVMPFDLSRTHHTFSKMPTGGVETVIVTDPSDAKDIALIRAHLRMEAQRFRQGDYADPARIHGMDMAGVHQLAASAAEVSVDYADLPNGGHISYSASDPALISALHAWFDRQTSDHAMPGMGG